MESPVGGFTPVMDEERFHCPYRTNSGEFKWQLVNIPIREAPTV